MHKWLKNFLYLVVIVAVVFFAWQTIQKIYTESTFQKFKKDLLISKIPPKTPSPFTLTDQYGKVISLSDFKNKKIVIEPMDPKCTDICPLVSKEIIDANKQLGKMSNDVVYIGLNVNENHNKVKDVKAFSDLHGLSKLPNWYFLTGTPDMLKKVWKAYGISVIPSKDGDVIHTSALIFVNSHGSEVYYGTPQNNKGSIKEWSNAISFILKTMS